MYTVKTCIKRTDVGQRKGGLLIFYDRWPLKKRFNWYEIFNDM